MVILKHFYIMAKSKVGGTRAYIRGRIGSDVYSVGKTSKGARQQVVRSLAETVSNPRTQEQMKGRMIMSTVMQAVSALQPIIDHSFDGLPVGQPSISEFIRKNYALVKADVAAHPASGNNFGLNKYQEKGVKPGTYQISDGNAILPTAVTIDGGTYAINLTADTATVGGLKAALGLTADGYITCVQLGDVAGASFFRLRLTTTLADTTAITADNVASLFTVEGNVQATANFASNQIYFSLETGDSNKVQGIIISDKVNGSWVHNKCVLTGDNGFSANADTALPTYPVGAEQFLNGGDL